MQRGERGHGGPVGLLGKFGGFEGLVLHSVVLPAAHLGGFRV